ncbi:kinase-like protein [Meira miltonrushii]|uniref:Kinase-like protein n=1 Tax=Meira miltonrushii TaxID=1280837 RepID=A0A316VK57_9BASI|nr:kinase-like protein [Meira miltonrushii]PWN37989.1 kinase-like protein [Meira miltonrushii]
MTMQSSQPEMSRLTLQRSPNDASSTSSSSLSRNSLDYSLPSTSSNLNTAAVGSTSHHKRPSASSISSTSSTSNSSKTAAFFNASFDNPIKPATSSNASIAPASKQSSPQKATAFTQNQFAINNDNNNSAAGQRISLEDSGNLSLSSLGWNSFGGGEPLGRTSSSIRRSWVDFEGKPIFALPSPGLSDEEGEKRGMNQGFMFPESTDSDMPARLSSHPSLPSIVTNTASSQDSKQEIIDSPKTLIFFGSGSSSSSQPAIVSAKEGVRSKYSSATLTATPSRLPSESDSLHAPSRLPSASASHPCPGLFANERSTADILSQDSSMGSSQSTPRVMGTQPLVPSAFVSPPSPDPNEGGGQSQGFNVSPVRNGFSRHTHGPSENVTSSSIVPPAEAMQLMDKATDVYRANADVQASASNTNDHLQESRPSPSPQTTPTMEESEDESVSRVGSYAVERVLGMGAFSKVVLARRQRVNQTVTGAHAPSSVGDLVALKMLEKEPCRQNERMRVSWVREVEVLRHIVHPNIVRFLSSFSTTRHHVLVLETVEGGELFEFLAQSQSEIANREWLVRRIFGELANAVGWMHTINLVHRDIKLENIILTQPLRGRNDLTPADLPSTPLIKLSDFGLSRFIDPNAPLLETRCGSEEYAAPELIIGKRYDGRLTDVWAMGVVLYALLSGSLPFLDFADTSSQGQGMINAREDAGPNYQTDPRARKQHLLRIAKGDLRWPQLTNDECMDVVDGRNCTPLHRLITPPARLLVARLLRRDSSKRISAWEVWDDDWMLKGSFSDANRGQGESSLRGQAFTVPSDPRLTEGQAWLNANARVQAGAPDVVHDD